MQKSDYSWENYLWCNGTSNTLTKYNTLLYLGIVDNKTTLEPADDAAHVNWGGIWRMPTKEELNELLNNCKCEWTTQGGKNGYMFTGTNGNSIFLPAAGAYYVSGYYDDDSHGHYWSSSLDTSYTKRAYPLGFIFDSVFMSLAHRDHGFSVRPVCHVQN